MKHKLLIIAAFFAAATVSVSAEAEKTYIWNGTTVFESGADYSVRDCICTEKTLIVPEGMTLYIRGDGKLTLEKNARLVVYGEVKINTGGVLRSYGSVEIAEGGEMNVYGELVSREDAKTEVSGRLNIFSDGYFNSIGDIEQAQSGVIYNGGRLYLRENASAELSGGLLSAEGSLTRIYGQAKLSGTAGIYGDFELKEKARLELGGALSIESCGTAEIYGEIKNAAESEITAAGRLKMLDGARLALNGRLEAAEGGFLLLSDGFSSEEGSSLVVNGKTELSEDLNLTLNGSLYVGEAGRIYGAGSIQMVDFPGFDCYGAIRAELKKPPLHYENGVAYVGSVMIVNKTYPLPAEYGDGIKPDAEAAYEKMKEESGFTFAIMSGYRSYSQQEQTFNHWVRVYGLKSAETISARPGESEHQSGYSFDVGGLNQSYIYTDEGKWLAENCWKYGFIIRFPKECTEHTGYAYEPWHIRYVGTEIARRIHEQGVCLEEFLGLA